LHVIRVWAGNDLMCNVIEDEVGKGVALMLSDTDDVARAFGGVGRIGNLGYLK
jgi:hypothetical protein